MKTHNLKIDVIPFNDLDSGIKTGEVRNDDRGFKAGDWVKLTCSDGRTMTRYITHIQRGYGLPDGLCVLSYAQVKSKGLSAILQIQAQKLQKLEKETDELFGTAVAWQERSKKAEAELTKIKNTAPIGYVDVNAVCAFSGLGMTWETVVSHATIMNRKTGKYCYPIYTVPLPVYNIMKHFD